MYVVLIPKGIRTETSARSRKKKFDERESLIASILRVLTGMIIEELLSDYKVTVCNY